MPIIRFGDFLRTISNFYLNLFRLISFIFKNLGKMNNFISFYALTKSEMKKRLLTDKEKHAPTIKFRQSNNVHLNNLTKLIF